MDRTCPNSDMSIYNIDNDSNTIEIKWSHNLFEDYKNLAYQYYLCGYKTFEDVINSGHDNVKSDSWFLTGIYLVRHSLELGLKALLCRIISKKMEIQRAFEECCHDVSKLYQRYTSSKVDNYLTNEENEWLIHYLDSLEYIDKKSDVFRYHFDEDFISKYKDKFLDNIGVANNLLQSFLLIKKCIEKREKYNVYEFDKKIKPEFFIFASHGIGNCSFLINIYDNFGVKIDGYSEVIDFLYLNESISKEVKLYPLIFMLRHTIELELKRLLISNVDNDVTLDVTKSQLKSHLIKKDLWRDVKPIIVKYSSNNKDKETIDSVEKLIEELTKLDKKGDTFRYPTTFGLEYNLDDVKLDISNVYYCLKAIINFLNGCDSMLSAIAEYKNEMLNCFI